VNDDERRQLLGVLGGVVIRHPLVQVADIEFVECDACRTKPGAPRLCAPCQMNRASIELLKSRVRLLEAEAAKRGER
jgi:hypothetical protein